MTDFLITAAFAALIAFWIVRKIFGKGLSLYNWKPLFVGIWIALMGMVSVFAS